MPRPNQNLRRIALFLEGETERALPPFIHRWVDPQLPEGKKVGITPVKFQGVSNYLDDLSKKVGLYLENGRADFVVGLVDLYGIPKERIDLSRHATIKDKIVAARGYIRNLVPKQYRDRFRQHFAVHEVEAWLLAYPKELSSEKEAQAQIKKRSPEEVNFKEPPAEFLRRILRGYKKTTTARNLFPRVDPQIAIDKCPYLKRFMDDLLALATLLQ
ncbi:MAG: DUF4276 family protein [Gemmataceae bacterium]|nr:DUF4276 family protein [Gemmataceae bacterium]MCI0739497.1 DUF4276 family protein [Gemmataceae bacterium]